jgi:uncharacterized protein YegP (UPF0339 family)
MYYEVYKSHNKFRWRARGGNNEIVATSQGYIHLRDCLHCIDIMRKSQDAPLKFKGKVE